MATKGNELRLMQKAGNCVPQFNARTFLRLRWIRKKCGLMKLFDWLEFISVELCPHFALAEYTTWWVHKYAENRRLMHRLFDYFLGSSPLMPLYLCTIIVAHRATEISNTTPDMGHNHKVLYSLPDDLSFKTLLVNAKTLHLQCPSDSSKKHIRESDFKRRHKEQEWKAKPETNGQET